MSDHYAEAQRLLQSTQFDDGRYANAQGDQPAREAAGVHARLAVADQLDAIGRQLAEMLAAWRRDIDSELPHHPRPQLCEAQHKPHLGSYICSLLAGHDGQHQATVDGEIVATWSNGGA